MKYKSNNNIVYSCKYHVVFCPKYRRKVLNNGVDERLKELINNICQELHVDLIEMKVMPCSFDFKGISSRILREEFSWLKSRLPTLWTNSYFVSTVGKAPISIIKQYIESQKRSE